MNEAITGLAAQVTAAYLSRNQVAVEEIPVVLKTVAEALNGLGKPVVVEPEPPKPAVPPKKSVFPDYIICLEDGKKLKMLKRHLRTCYGMSPDEYRQRWGLPADYPMTAPAYAAQRSDLAKQHGLGKRPATEA